MPFHQLILLNLFHQLAISLICRFVITTNQILMVQKGGYSSDRMRASLVKLRGKLPKQVKLYKLATVAYN
jgi:hypothetical protein